MRFCGLPLAQRAEGPRQFVVSFRRIRLQIEAVLQSLLRAGVLMLLVERRSQPEIGLRVPRLNLRSLVEGKLSIAPSLQLHVSDAQQDVALAVPGIKLHHLLELCNAGFGIVLAEEKLLSSRHGLRGFCLLRPWTTIFFASAGRSLCLGWRAGLAYREPGNCYQQEQLQ